MKYNGNDVFTPFNAGLYGYDSDSDRSLQYEDTKETILSEFKREYEKEITDTLAAAGIKYIGLSYFSPREYNFMTDSIDLEIEIVDKTLLIAALNANRPAIEKAMSENKSYDGYMALTADTWDEMIEKIDARGLDIIALTVLLSGIDFDPDLIHEWIVWEYQCDDCKLIHADIEYMSDDDKMIVAHCEADARKALENAARDANNLKLPL